MTDPEDHTTTPHGDPLGGLVPERDGEGRREGDAGGGSVSEHLGLTGILDAIAEAVGKARAMPMSSSALVSRAELLDLVDQARAALPSQLVAADEVLARVEATRSAAAEQAERLLAEARREAADLVSRESVTQEALAGAERIRAEALEDAERMRREADDYCDRRLADFEIDLGRVLAQVQAGRARLAERLE